MRANWAMADTFATFRSFRFRASFWDFHTGAARKGRWADEFHCHRLLLLFFRVVRANWTMADKFAAFWPFRYWASFGDFLAGAAWKGRRAIGRDSDGHYWFRLVLLLGVVRRADRAMHMFAAFWSFWFRASFRDFLARAAWTRRRAGSIRFHRGFSEFHFEVFDAFVRADERAFEELAMVGSFNWRTTLGRAFARTAWARRRANLLLEG
jgi:hypothetical protein